MRRWWPAFDYPPSRQGYWHPVTSTLNWCEEDYYATYYSAEIVNTLTNLLFLWLAVKGIRNSLKEGHDPIFLVTFFGYLLVGTGSFLFHSTLKYPMQLVDELSMIYTTCLMCYATFSYARSRLFALFLALFLVSLAVFITAYYHYLQNPVFHQNMYALLTTVVLLRSMYVMELSIRPSLRSEERKRHLRARNGRTAAQEKARQVPDDHRDEKILKTMWVMIACGLSVFLGGFGIWNLDNVYCSDLRRWRRQIGLPWGILLEGHGWWHLMTGIGAYFYIVWGIWLRHCLNGRQDEYEMRWPHVWVLPEVVRIKVPKGSAVVNGHTKKTR